MVSLQSIIWVFLLNNFSRAINLLLTKLARDHTGRISALGLFVCARSVLSRPRADILPVQPLRLVNKIYISNKEYKYLKQAATLYNTADIFSTPIQTLSVYRRVEGRRGLNLQEQPVRGYG